MTMIARLPKVSHHFYDEFCLWDKQDFISFIYNIKKEELIMKIKFWQIISFVLILMNVLPTIPAAAVGWEAGISTPSSNTATLTKSSDSQKAVEDFNDQVFLLVNKERTNKNLSLLKKTATLDGIADIRAKESSVLFSHTRPNGKSPASVFEQFKLSYQYAGENLAYGCSTPAELITAWMKSPEHRSNILSKNFTCIGIGLYQNSKGIYSSLIFDKP